MCFSASASFVASATTGFIGIATFLKTRFISERPLASIPFLFGIQQLVEGFVWLSFQDPHIAAWNDIATLIYSLFSHVLWPVFVPLAVYMLETDSNRRKTLRHLLLLGTLMSMYLLFFIAYAPVTSEVINNSIRYNYHHHYPVLTMLLYLIVVCMSFLVSSFSILRFFGAVLVVSFAVAYLAFTLTFFSVWCFFAGILSLILYLHFHRRANLKTTDFTE